MLSSQLLLFGMRFSAFHLCLCDLFILLSKLTTVCHVFCFKLPSVEVLNMEYIPDSHHSITFTPMTLTFQLDLDSVRGSSRPNV